MTKKTAKVLNEHVAWLRFTGHGSFADGRMNRLVLCDSDDEGAFKVFRECTVREILEQGAAAMELAERQDKRIAELEAARRWIPVSERLPAHDKFVLAAVKYSSQPIIAKNTGFGWVACTEDYEVSCGTWCQGGNVKIAEHTEITHWRELDALPEDKESAA